MLRIAKPKMTSDLKNYFKDSCVIIWSIKVYYTSNL